MKYHPMKQLLCCLLLLPTLFLVPHAKAQQAAAAVPLYRDPVHDGAADPVVIWNTQRKASH